MLSIVSQGPLPKQKEERVGFTLHGIWNHVLGPVRTLDHYVRISVSRCEEELAPGPGGLQKHLSCTHDPSHVLDLPKPNLSFRDELYDALRRLG